jgi:hypothetical protein
LGLQAAEFAKPTNVPSFSMMPMSTNAKAEKTTATSKVETKTKVTAVPKSETKNVVKVEEKKEHHNIYTKQGYVKLENIENLPFQKGQALVLTVKGDTVVITKATPSK